MQLTNTLLLAGLSVLASAQTFTACNPTVNSTCPNDPAMKETFDTDFRKGIDSIKGWKLTAGKLDYKPEGAEFTMHKRYDSVTIQSETYLLFGYVEVKMKAASGKGIISSIVVQSEDLDEVDWEFIGTVDSNVQTNYFGKGNTTSYDRMREAPVAKPQETFHTYALDWKPEGMTWLIDGVAVRTLKYEEAVGGKNYPQTPSTVRLGIWAGGDPDNSPGTIEWAGGETDFSKAPFTMTVESVKIKNYNPGTEYKWTDKSGDWKSIEVVGKGKPEGAPENEKPIPTSAVPTPVAPEASAASSTKGDHGVGVGHGTNAPKPSSVPSGKPGDDAPKVTTDVKTLTTTTCTDKANQQSTATPQISGKPSTNGTVPHDDDKDCSCGTHTVTVIGSGPPTAPPAVPTTLSSTIKNSTIPAEKPSSASPPPAVTVPPVAPPTVSTPTGLVTDSKPSPSAPLVPTAGNQTASTTAPAQFTGAATQLGRGKAMLGAVVLGAVGVAMF